MPHVAEEGTAPHRVEPRARIRWARARARWRVSMVAGARRAPAMMFAVVMLVAGAGRPIVRAQPNEWVAVGPLWDGEVLSLAQDPSAPEIVYAGTRGGGIFKSVNGGATWRNTGVTRREVRALVIDAPSRSLYAGTVGIGDPVRSTGGVFKSIDGGATWRSASAGLRRVNGPGERDPVDVFSLAIDRDRPTTLYAGTNAGVFKTVDGAGGWGPRSGGLPVATVVSLIVPPGGGDVAYAGLEGGGVFQTRDGAASWSEIWAAPPGANFRVVLVLDPSDPQRMYAATRGGTSGGGVFKSEDGGRTWMPRGRGLPGCPDCVGEPDCPVTCANLATALAVDPQATATLYVSTSNGVFRSLDRGTSWEARTTGIPAGGVGAMLIGLGAPSSLYVAAGGEPFGEPGRGVLKTTDGGAVWQPSSIGLTTSTIGAVLVDAAADAGVYAATNRGLYASADRGATWGPLEGVPASCAVAALSSDATTGAVYAGTVPLRTDPCGVFVTADGGRTWTGAGLAGHRIESLAVDPTTVGVLYVGTGGDGVAVPGALYKTTNGGHDWAATPAGTDAATPDLGFPAIALDPEAPSTLYAATTVRGVIKSVDGGTTWMARSAGLLSPSVRAVATDPRQTARLWAGTSAEACCDAPNGGDVFASADGALAWSSSVVGLGNLNVNAVVPDPFTNGVLYAGTTRGVFRSADGGITWVAVARGMIELSVLELALDPHHGRTLWAGTRDGGLYRMDIATDFVVDRELEALGVPAYCDGETYGRRLDDTLDRTITKARKLTRKAAVLFGIAVRSQFGTSRARRAQRLMARADRLLDALRRGVRRAERRGAITSVCEARLDAAVVERQLLLQAFVTAAAAA
jgi:hypothetical protein